MPRRGAVRGVVAAGAAGLLVALLLVVPAPARAYTPHAPIQIVGDAAFTAANGVTRGTGTPSDPYVIEGWEIALPTSAHGIRIEGTSAAFVVRDVYVRGSNDSAYDGIYLRSTNGGRIENATVTGASSGVHFDAAYNVTLANSTVAGNRAYGLQVEFSERILVRGNSFDRNAWEGVYLWSSRDAAIDSNTMVEDGVGIYDRCQSALPTCLDRFVSHTITPDNAVNGLPLRFEKNCNGVTIDGEAIGQLIAVNCTGLRAKGLYVQQADVAVEIAYSDGAVIEGSVLRRNSRYGILAYASADLRISGNSLPQNPSYGIHVDRVSGLNLSENRVADGINGVRLWNSGPGIVVGNNFTLLGGVGLHLDNASGFRVYHNGFASNGDNAFNDGTGNEWDDGYPSGGNSWSDYDGRDCCAGPAQGGCAAAAPDGIGDTPYLIPVGGEDRYPIVLGRGFNIPPIPRIGTVGPLRVGETVMFDARSSFDPDWVGPLEARWDFDGDGAWDTGWDEAMFATRVYDEAGEYWVRLEVRDRFCAAGQETLRVNVAPAPSPPPDPILLLAVTAGATAAAVSLVLFLLRRPRERRREPA